MDREQARAAVNNRLHIRDYLEKSKGGLYKCPMCGSGNGQHGTGAVKVYDDTNTFYCHKCNKSGDAVFLYGQYHGMTVYAATNELAQQYGIEIDDMRGKTGPHSARTRAETSRPNMKTQEQPKARQEAAQRPTASPENYAAYFAECSARITEPAAVSYLNGRGINPGTALAYGVGYDPAADPAQGGHPTPRIIFPSNEHHYAARATDPDTAPGYKVMNPKGAPIGFFNEACLYDDTVKEVFICEGGFDALSILEAGGNAVALNSAANAAKFVKMMEQRPTNATVVLCLDNDPQGKESTDTIRQGLQRLNISFIVADICGDSKDPNEAMQKDRAAFFDAVALALTRTAAKPDNTTAYIDSLMARDIDAFKSDKKTGFANLDKCSGGLYAGLYVIAAISSLGKTTFAHQVSDQIAAAGNDVLFFSLEQSRLEMVSKSLSRIVAQHDPDTKITSLAIRKGYLPHEVLEAAKEYKGAVGDRLSVIEGNFSCDISFIGNYVREYISRTKTRPVVVVDYLQILQPEKDSKGRQQTTKETVDVCVTELKRLSREMGLTIFAISSVNRANYETPIAFESLKESGLIEYSADVVWGLQLQCLNDDLFSQDKKVKEKRERVKEAKAAIPRKIELVCLKNRYGAIFDSCYFDYFPQHDLFKPAAGADADFVPVPTTGKGRKRL